ncbi:helix-turn-helix domain-containing protein [Ruminococcus flavefaciens]|uniref:helix-turn-helix domain-containing protein n=1 Tax=Ruminococcus flavefaciens TaxID=1265 RepID=UPI0026F0C56E|nr:helix-turn-helix transcriptional regulator [Ruminococcus flavefaciens]
MAKIRFIPFEYPKSIDGQFIAVLGPKAIIYERRMQLRLTQQQVADMAGIKLAQYQRFESDDGFISRTSMKIGLAVCAVLMLDPYELLGINVRQPDPKNMKPVPMFDSGLTEDFFAPKRPGRKTMRKEIMTVFVNHKNYSFIIPYEVLEQIGCPKFIQLKWDIEKRCVVFRAAKENEDEVFDVPEQKYEKSLFVLPPIKGNNPIAAMNWGDKLHEVKSRLVLDKDNTVYVMIDLNTGKETDGIKIEGIFIPPECLSK